MKSKIAQIAVPVLPLPELQCTTTTCFYETKPTLKNSSLTLNPHESLLAYLVDVIEGWTVVVWPIVGGDSSPEIALSIVCVSLRCIYYPVLIAVSFVKISRYLLNPIPVHRLYAARWIGHCYYVWRYVGEIQVNIALFHSPPIARYKLANAIHLTK